MVSQYAYMGVEIIKQYKNRLTLEIKAWVFEEIEYELS